MPARDRQGVACAAKSRPSGEVVASGRLAVGKPRQASRNPGEKSRRSKREISGIVAARPSELEAIGISNLQLRPRSRNRPVS